MRCISYAQMVRCAQCGLQTELLLKGSRFCIFCDEKEKAREQARDVGFDGWPEVGSRLAVARDDYRMALWVQGEALALRHTLDQTSPEASRALHEANLKLEKAAAKYDEALRQFVAEQASRRRAS